jgi:hypothetical protein
MATKKDPCRKRTKTTTYSYSTSRNVEVAFKAVFVPTDLSSYASLPVQCLSMHRDVYIVSSSVLRGYTGSLDNARATTRTALAAPQAAALSPLQLRRHPWRHLHSRRGLQVSSSHAHTLPQEVCLRLARAVHETCEARFLRCERTGARHDAAAIEFGQFLESFFSANSAEDWLRCTPDIVLAFIHLHLLPRYAGRSGQPVAPSTLRGYLDIWIRSVQS